MPNLVWGNYPLGFESSMLIVVCVREVTSACSDLFVESWPFRVLMSLYSLCMMLVLIRLNSYLLVSPLHALIRDNCFRIHSYCLFDPYST